MAEQFDPTLLTTGPALIGLTIYLTWVLVRAICGDDGPARDRFGPGIAAAVAVSLSAVYVLVPNFETYMVVLIGVFNGAASSGIYKALRFGANTLPTPSAKPPAATE